MSFSKNDSKLKEHQKIHLNNPQINYIKRVNCVFCKLDRRESFGNCFSCPRTITSDTKTNIDFKNIKRIPKEVFNTSNNMSSIDNENIRDLDNYAEQIQSIRERIASLNDYINSVHRNNERIRDIYNLTSNRFRVTYNNQYTNNQYTNNQYTNNQHPNNYDNDDDEDSDIEYGFPNESDIKKINDNSILEVFRETQMKQCSVCYTNIKFGDIVRKLKCNHIFHQECVDKWLEEKLSCPLCRYKFT